MLALTNGIGASGIGATGWPQIRSMQEALTALSQVTGNVNINPGSTNGFADTRTTTAVIASLGVIGKFLGSTTAGLIQATAAIYSIADPEHLHGLILQYAPRIEQAARAAAIAYTQGGAVPAPAPGPAVPTLPPTGATPWYKTWWGIGGIAVGGIGLLAIILAPPRRAAQAA